VLPYLGKFWFKAGKFFSLLGNSPFGKILGWPIFLIFYVLSKKKLARNFFWNFSNMYFHASQAVNG